MRVVVVGPTHPSKGGISQHTTHLVHHLVELGDDVVLCSWASQYPKHFYPGDNRLPGNQPEIEPFPETTRVLRWWWPIGWILAGRRHRAADAIVLVVASPVQVPACIGLIAGVRGRRARGRPRVVALCHNVLPHEAGRTDRALMALLLRRVDGILTHTPAMSEDASSLAGVPTRVAPLPIHFPDLPVRRLRPSSAQRRVLFFGYVRPYKGVDVLVHALAKTPALSATIAGEFWTDVKELQRDIDALELTERVIVRPGYVDATDIPALFADFDALILPYRSATASQNVKRAHAYGVPVIATRVGSFPTDVHDGIDGILCEPGDADALAAALTHLYEPGVLDKLRKGIVDVDESSTWHRYIEALRELVAPTRVPSPRHEANTETRSRDAVG